MTSPTDAMTSISLHDLARRLGIEPPQADLEITGLGTIDDAGPTQLTFLANDSYAVNLKSSRAGAALVAEDFDGDVPMPLLRTALPRLAFAQIMDLFHPPGRLAPGVHPTAIVPASCTVGEAVHIGAYVVLGERVTLGDGVTLHPHAVVYDDVHIGAGSEIHSHVSLRHGVVLGERVIVQNGSVVGADGFGFEPDAEGRLHKVPQPGGVRIGDDVELQANVCVDRSSLGDTVIGRGTKIDNLAQVAHGCIVGEDVVLCGQVGLGGSTKVGNHAMLGGQVGSGGHVEIGDGVQVAAQSGVITNLPAGERYGGTPAMPMQSALRTALFLPQLPDIARRLKKVERALEKLGDS